MPLLNLSLALIYSAVDLYIEAVRMSAAVRSKSKVYIVQSSQALESISSRKEAKLYLLFMIVAEKRLSDCYLNEVNFI